MLLAGRGPTGDRLWAGSLSPLLRPPTRRVLVPGSRKPEDPEWRDQAPAARGDAGDPARRDEDADQEDRMERPGPHLVFGRRSGADPRSDSLADVSRAGNL